MTIAALVLVVFAPDALAQHAKRAMGVATIGSPGEWITPDDYPPDALREGRAGRVVVEIGVDSGGKPVSCHIKVSSETTSLDDKTCAIALERGRFSPATDSKGQPIASTFLLPVSWVLPDSPKAIDLDSTPLARNIETEMTISADGIITSCRVISQIPAATSPMEDPCKEDKPGTELHTVFQKGGQPIPVVIDTRYSSSVKPLKAAP